MTDKKRTRAPNPFAGTSESSKGYERYWTRPGRDKHKLVFNGATKYLFEKGRPADHRRRGLAWLKRAARDGDVLAAFNLAYAYQWGHGVTRNLARARKGYQVAYGGGFERAKSFLANALTRSRDPEARRRGARMERELADDGHIICAYNTGLAFEFGRGYRVDRKRAEHYYLKAARAGDVDAQCALGYWALHPEDAPKGSRRNLDLAEKWYRLAARSGEPMAIRSLRDIARLRREQAREESRRRRKLK